MDLVTFDDCPYRLPSTSANARPFSVDRNQGFIPMKGNFLQAKPHYSLGPNIDSN